MRAETPHKGLFVVLIATALLVSPGVAAATEPKDAQEQSAEKRLQDQERRIKDLEMRLKDIEAAAMAGKAPEAGPPAAPAAAELPKPERLDVSAGQSRGTHQVLTGADLASTEFPGSWPMFGSDYRMKIGGYVKVDALYDIDGTGDKYQFLISQIAVDGTPEAGRGGYFNLFAKETRFNFDIRKTTHGEPAQKVFIEMDFFDEGSSSPRLRHAYLVYGNLIIGQTWSILTELRAVPFMIDFAYGDALFGGRTTQVRWQQQAGRNWSWAAGIEMLDRSGIDNPQGLPGTASPAWPVLVGRVTYEDDTTLVMLGGAIDQLRWDGEGAGPNATANAWAVVLNGRQNFGERDYATWQLSYGDGAAENIMALAGSDANATLLPNGHLQTNKALSATLGFVHNFSERVTTNLAYARTELEQNDLRDPNGIKGGWVAHANLIWRLTKAIRTGIEYMWGLRENADGAVGRAARVQTMFMYNF